MKKYVIDVFKTFKIGEGSTNVGLVQMGEDAKTEFELSEYSVSKLVSPNIVTCQYMM